MTSSMLATKSALCSGGITQPLCRCGLSVFFSGSGAPFRMKWFRQLELNKFLGEQLQGLLGLALSMKKLMDRLPFLT